MKWTTENPTHPGWYWVSERVNNVTPIYNEQKGKTPAQVGDMHDKEMVVYIDYLNAKELAAFTSVRHGGKIVALSLYDEALWSGPIAKPVDEDPK